MALAGVACGRIGFDDRPSSIAWRSTSTATIPMTGGLGVTLDQPPGTAPGDLLVAVLAMGSTGDTAMALFQPPIGWTEIRRDDEGDDTTLICFQHTAGDGEPATYAWTFSDMIEGVAWISAYTGASVDAPIANDGILIDSAGPAYTAPALATTAPDSLVLVAFIGHDAADTGSTTWQPPAGSITRALLDNGSTRSGLGVELAMASPGTTGDLTATASMPQDYGLVDILALAPER